MGAFLAADLLLLVLYAVDSLAGRPIGHFVDLNRELNLPTAYASAQLLVVAVLLALDARVRFDAGALEGWALWGLPLMFAGLAADEALRGHEKLGLLIDEVVPGAERSQLPFDETGLWMFIIGIPFVVVTGLFVYRFRTLYPRRLLVVGAIGFGIFMGGALGLETLASFFEYGSSEARYQIAAEEGAELIGVTVILGAAFALARERGGLDEVARQLAARRSGATGR